MTYLIARSELDDFDEWKAAFDDHTEARIEHGCRRFTVLRGVDDREFVTVVMEFDTEANARSWADYVDDPADLSAAGMRNAEFAVFEAVQDWAEARPTA